MTTEQVMEKVKLLMALSESPVQGEADAALAKANELLLRHNLTMSEVEKSASEYTESKTSYDSLPLEFKYVATIIQKYFFVQAIRSPQDKWYAFVGTKENVKIANFMFYQLRENFQKCWYSYKRVNRYANRPDFYTGLFSGLNDKLRKERERLKQEEGLVWVSDPKLQEFYKKLHPSTSSRRQSMGRQGTESASAGYSEGSNMSLRQGMEHGARRAQFQLSHKSQGGSDE